MTLHETRQLKIKKTKKWNMEYNAIRTMFQDFQRPEKPMIIMLNWSFLMTIFEMLNIHNWSGKIGSSTLIWFIIPLYNIGVFVCFGLNLYW